jgi:hypothetical protein
MQAAVKSKGLTDDIGLLKARRAAQEAATQAGALQAQRDLAGRQRDEATSACCFAPSFCHGLTDSNSAAALAAVQRQRDEAEAGMRAAQLRVRQLEVGRHCALRHYTRAHKAGQRCGWQPDHRPAAAPRCAD